MNKTDKKSKKVPRAAALHDLSCFGRCALTVIDPVLSAMGVQCMPMPTALLSTHTGGFSGMYFQELDDALQKTISESAAYNAAKKVFSPKELSALLIGSYFGLVFQKFMRGEAFGDGEDVKLTINKFITLITNRVEDKL